MAIDTSGLHLEEDRFHIFRVNMFPHEMPACAKKTASWYRRYYRWKRKN
ncbi:hypothetical protein [Hymenobacter amundsenii]|nr:hypothetical protein [Hymenobacter amundsenii]